MAWKGLVKVQQVDSMLQHTSTSTSHYPPAAVTTCAREAACWATVRWYLACSAFCSALCCLDSSSCCLRIASVSICDIAFCALAAPAEGVRGWPLRRAASW